MVGLGKPIPFRLIIINAVNMGVVNLSQKVVRGDLFRGHFFDPTVSNFINFLYKIVQNFFIENAHKKLFLETSWGVAFLKKKCPKNSS